MSADRGVSSGGRAARTGVVVRVGQIAATFLAIAALLFGGARSLGWAWGWAYLAVYLAGTALTGWLLRRRPDQIAERGRPAEGAPAWDALLGGGWALLQFIALPLVAALDVRLGWTGGVGLAWHLVGAAAFAAGLGLFGWAMAANAWFSTVARIQPDRGQAVCREGPYGWVRHPGYAGAILLSLGSPLMLGSAWAAIPALAASALMAVRTPLEDRLLRAGLPGYAEYARSVPWRLLPRVW